MERTQYKNQMKADLDIIKMILGRNAIDARTTQRIINDIREVVAEIRPDPQPRQKKKFVLVASDPKELIDRDLTGWALQIPEEDPPWTVMERIAEAAAEFNQTKKGRRMPVKTVGEACEMVPARIFKEHGLYIKTKEPVEVLPTKNRLPVPAAYE